MSGRRTRLALLAGAALAAMALTVAIALSGALDQLELDTVDARYGLRSEDRPDGYVVVAIDDRTFDELNRQWPFPRSLHARVIDRIRAGRARAIGFDVQFTEPTSDAEDGALIDAVERARGMVLATTEVGRGGSTNVLGGDELLREIGARAGYAQVPSDVDGAVRRVPATTSGLDHFGLALARAAVGRALPTDRARGTVWVDYAGRPKTFRTVSYSQVLRGKVPATVFRDRIVIVGPSAPSLQDVHETGVSHDALMSGAELEANITRTFIEGIRLRGSAGWLEELLGALLALVAPLAATRWRAPIALALGLATAALYLGVALVAFALGLVLPLAAPLLGAALGFVGATAIGAMSAAYDRERVHDLFARFVPAAVVGQVLERAGDGVRLGGEERLATVMFSDLRGFTTFSERLHAAAVIDVLNDYLGEMSEAILSNGGTLVAFMGDGIFAVFGAPLDQTDHADRALASAREMTGPRLAAFNDRLERTGIETRFRMGVGLNTGAVVSGNVGSSARLEYAAIGDTTNTAARIEGMTKDHGTMVLLSEATRAALLREPADLVDIGEVAVRGRSRALRLWGVPDAEGSEAEAADAPAAAEGADAPAV